MLNRMVQSLSQDKGGIVPGGLETEPETMPIYIYKTNDQGCEYCQDGFEQVQAMSAKPLAKCPQCGGKVKKIPAICSYGKDILSNSNLRDKGFTKLVNKGGGTFEKTT
jgi:putative FmdB family regulatory protein